MKKLLTMVLALLVLALPAMAWAEETEPATLTLTGSAKVSTPADYARVLIGVRTTEKTVGAASTKNAAAIQAVLNALKLAGVKDEDIVTASYDVSVEYDYNVLGKTLTGYTVMNQLSVTLRDMTRIGATLDLATQAGANEISSISFLSDRATEAQDEALTLAIQEAARRAKLMADAAGMQLGRLVSMSSSFSGYSVSRSYDFAAAEATANFVIPDAQTLTASVTVVYELK